MYLSLIHILPKLNVIENVKLPLMYRGMKENEQKERAMAALQRVGLADKYKMCIRDSPRTGSIPVSGTKEKALQEECLFFGSNAQRSASRLEVELMDWSATSRLIQGNTFNRQAFCLFYW